MQNVAPFDLLSERQQSRALGMRPTDRYRHASRVLELAEGDCVPPPLPDGYSELRSETEADRSTIEKAIYRRFREAGIAAESKDEIQVEYAPYLEGSQAAAVMKHGEIAGTMRIKVGTWEELSASSLYDLGEDTPTVQLAEYDGFSVARGEPNPFIIQYTCRSCLNMLAGARVPAVIGLAEPMVIDLLGAAFNIKVYRHTRGFTEQSHEVYLLWIDMFDVLPRWERSTPAYGAWMTEAWSDETLSYYKSRPPQGCPPWAIANN